MELFCNQAYTILFVIKLGAVLKLHNALRIIFQRLSLDVMDRNKILNKFGLTYFCVFNHIFYFSAELNDILKMVTWLFSIDSLLCTR